MARAKMKMTYEYEFSPFQLQPVLQTRVLFEEDEVLGPFSKQEVLDEKPMREAEKKEIAVSLAEAHGRTAATEMSQMEGAPAEKEQKTTQSYTLAYYNPETQKTEVFAAKSDIRVKDHAKQVIEEAVGKTSTYPMYSYIASPIVIQQVEPHILQQILQEREYGTPPPFGGAAVVKVGKSEEAESRIVAVEKAEIAHGALVETLRRRETVIAKLEEEIILLEETADALLKESPQKALRRLGPLTRARFLLALKQKKIPPKVIISMIERDIRFVKAVKKKLMILSTEDLLGIVRAIKLLGGR